MINLEKTDANSTKSNVIICEVVVVTSLELVNFEVEAPALKQKITMQVSMPAAAVFNPFTNEKFVLGVKKIKVEAFLKKVKDLIYNHNVTHKKIQQVNISDEAICAIYKQIDFSEYETGHSIKIEFPIPARWFALRSGNYGFKWNNKLGAGVFLIASQPCFSMEEYDASELGLEHGQFTSIRGTFKLDVWKKPMFVIEEGGKHLLIKNILRKNNPCLNTINNLYYRYCEEKGNRNEYAVVESLTSKQLIKIETIREAQEIVKEVIETLPEPPKEIIIENITTEAAEAFVESLEKGKKKAKAKTTKKP